LVALDDCFYKVLNAALSTASPGSACHARVVAALPNAADAHEYLAAMVDEGWLEGLVERGPTGRVDGVFVQTISTTGRRELIDRLAYSAGHGGLHTLGQVARQSPSVDEAEVARLIALGLISPAGGLSDLGALLLTAEARQSVLTGTTVIQGVTNSQVAVGASRVEGNLSVNEAPLDRADIISALEEIANRVAELELRHDVSDEILADLATIRSQLDSPKPKRAIISACAENVRAVLQGAVGSAVYVGFLEVLKRLTSG
jgi:hypothetical protein